MKDKKKEELDPYLQSVIDGLEHEVRTSSILLNSHVPAWRATIELAQEMGAIQAAKANNYPKIFAEYKRELLEACMKAGFSREESMELIA